MDITPRSETEALRVSNRRPWKDGWYDAVIDTAAEKLSAKDNKMIELSVIVNGRTAPKGSCRIGCRTRN